jgi:rhomboid protease GluP
MKSKFNEFLRSADLTAANMTIVSINVIIFIITGLLSFFGDFDVYEHLSSGYQSVIMDHEYYRLLTSMFTHAGIEHLGNNMLMLIIMGTYLERAVGPKRYLLIYFLSGIGGSFASMYANIYQGKLVAGVGASGAIFGVMGAFLFVVIIHKGHAEGLSSRQMIFLVIFAIYGGMVQTGVDNYAHIGGAVTGFLSALLIDVCLRIFHKEKLHYYDNSGHSTEDSETLEDNKY